MQNQQSRSGVLNVARDLHDSGTILMHCSMVARYEKTRRPSWSAGIYWAAKTRSRAMRVSLSQVPVTWFPPNRVGQELVGGQQQPNHCVNISRVFDASKLHTQFLRCKHRVATGQSSFDRCNRNLYQSLAQNEPPLLAGWRDVGSTWPAK